MKELTLSYPEIVTVAVNYNYSKSSEIYGQETEIIWGQDTIQEEVLDYNFALSPRAFYQLNPKQTEVLYGQAVEAFGKWISLNTLLMLIVVLVLLDLHLPKKSEHHSGGWILFPEAIEDARKKMLSHLDWIMLTMR